MKGISELVQMRYKYCYSTFLLLCLITAGLRLNAQAASANIGDISGPQLKAYLSFVASPNMEGRDTPSRGLDITADFIATLLARWGATPAGDNGTYFQRILLTRHTLDTTLISAELNNQPLVYREQYGARPVASSVSAPMVFGGDGWFIKAKHADPYQSVNPKGKWVVLLYGNGNPLPPGITRADLSGVEGIGWEKPAQYAFSKGAAGILYVFSKAQGAVWASTVGASEFERIQPEKLRTDPIIPEIYLRPDVSASVFNGEKVMPEIIFGSYGGTGYQKHTSFALKNTHKVTVHLAVITERAATQNVIATFEGSDPLLKTEYVAVGAHYDHDGKLKTPVNGHSIYPGADDDGSGTCALLAIAEALSKSAKRPPRSTLCIWHCGEEKHFWGSKYYTSAPTVVLGKITAMLNMDMIGRSKFADDKWDKNASLAGPDEVYTIGPNVMCKELGLVAAKANRLTTNMVLNSSLDSSTEASGYFFRSDHYQYAMVRIPSIFFFDGGHIDYHDFSDTVDNIDFAKLEKTTRMIYATLWELAALDHRMKVEDSIPRDPRELH